MSHYFMGHEAAKEYSCLLRIFTHGEILAVQMFQQPTCFSVRFDMIGTRVTLNITTAEQLTGQTLLILHLRPEMRF